MLTNNSYLIFNMFSDSAERGCQLVYIYIYTYVTMVTETSAYIRPKILAVE